MRKFLLFVIFAFTPFTLPAESHDKNFIVLLDRGSGMFSEFNDVLCVLDCYEKDLCAGLQVDFGEKGFYYEPTKGPNWWQYYCEPINIGDRSKGKILAVTGLRIPNAIPRISLITYPRKKAAELTEKYIHVKPHIRAKVDAFVSKNFKNSFIIGVHYRGTDKMTVAPRVAYDEVFKEINEKIAELGLQDYKIFVATDENDFIKYVSEAFPNKIIYRKAAVRSNDGDPVHIQAESPYKVGEDAILDCLLLSRTDFLIRTTSNLSLWSTYFNPELPFYNLSELYLLDREKNVK